MPTVWKSRLLALFLFIVFCLPFFWRPLVFSFNSAALAVPAASARVGTIPGEFAVNGNGGANYTIPIEVPPGTNGVQPNIFLTYNSQASNGLLGVGWNLAGFSAIARCGKTIATDGERGGVNFDNNDRFCLDGQRLIAVEGKDGEDDTEYHTERETWIKVISHTESKKKGPKSFTAITKDGHQMEFGVTDDSRIEARGREDGAVRVWAANKITDRNGNYVEISYQTDSQSREPAFQSQSFLGYYPTEIRYTGNDDNDTKLTPQRLVKFDYDENREDIITAYVGGSDAQTTQRLESIKTYVDLDGDGSNIETEDNLVKEYRLNYKNEDEDEDENENYSFATGRSLLRNIQECDVDGICLPATEFTYKRNSFVGIFGKVDGPPTYVGNDSDVNAESYGSRYLTMDVNGDGLIDLVEIFYGSEPRENSCHDSPSSTACAVSYVSKEDGSFQRVNEKISYVGHWGDLDDPEDVHIYLPMDVNGDSLLDLVEIYRSGEIEPINCSDADKTCAASYISKGDGSFQRVEPLSEVGNWSNVDAPDARRYLPMDVDGDGLLDLVELYKDTNCSTDSEEKTCAASWISAGDGTFQEPKIASSVGDWSDVDASDARRYLQTDVNGDGLPDLVEIYQGTNCSTDGEEKTCAASWISQGDGSFIDDQKPPTAVGDWSDVDAPDARRYFPMDVNRDGADDLVEIYQGTNCSTDGEEKTCAFSWKSQRDGTFKGVDSPHTSYLGDWSDVDAPDAHRYLPMDVNGDSAPDLVKIYKGDCGDSEEKTCAASFQNGTERFPDLVTRITNGIGGKTEIEYKPLTDKEVYWKQTRNPEKYVQIVKAPMYVVSQHTVKDEATNPTNEFIYEHFYLNAKVDLRRGWLGFEKTILIDQQNSTATITTYSQEFPILGMMLSREISNDIDHAKNRAKFEVGKFCDRFPSSSRCKKNDLLGTTKSQYTSKQDEKGVYKLWKYNSSIEYYTEGKEEPDYTLKQSSLQYSDYQNAGILHDWGDTSSDDDDVYTCLEYYNPTKKEEKEDWWKSFFPTQQKIVNNLSACLKKDNWNPETDLRWEKFEYDDHMNLISRSQYRDKSGPDDNQGKWLKSTTEYDSYGNVVSMSDPLGNTSTISYESNYHTFPQTYTTPKPDDPNNPTNEQLTVETTYEPKFGIKTGVIDPNGHKTMEILDSGIDGFGRVLEVRGIKPDSDEMVALSKTKFNPESSGMSVKTWYRTQWDGGDTPDNTTWLWEQEYIDGLGRSYKSESKGNNSQTKLVDIVKFNDKGQVEKDYLPTYLPGFSDPNQIELINFLTYEYDIRGQITQITQPNKAVTKTDYEKQYSDRQITYQLPDPREDADESNLVNSLVKETSRGWVKQKTAPDDSNAVYEYDLLGRVVGILDPLAEETEIVYNSLGQVLSETSTETGTTKYTYNDNGKLDSRIDAKGQKVSFEYDNLGRVTKKKVDDQQSDAKTVTYQYDDPALPNTKGQLTKIIMPEGLYGFQYNNLGEVKQETVEVEIEGTQKAFITGYTYDAAGRPDTITYPDGSIVRHSYDYQGKLYTIELKEAGEGDFTTYATYGNYTALGNLGTVSYNNGVESEYKYDEIGRIKNSKTQKGGYSYLDFTYEWNKANKLLKIEDQREIDDPEKKLTETFRYNNVGRLIAATGPYPSITYDYDRAGNITKRNDQTFNYKSDRKHQLADAQYDLNGNTTAYSPWSYTYDAEDRLLRVNKEESENTINEFTYDDSGDRLTKTEADGTKTYYVSPLYEVVRQSSGSQVHTKYIVGPQGVVAAISKDGSNFNLITELNYNTASLKADMYNNLRNWRGLGQFLSAKASQLVYYPNLGRLLVIGMLIGWLLFAVLLCTYQFCRSASRESWVGKARGLLLEGLVQLGWLPSNTATRLKTSNLQSWLNGAWYRPWLFILALVAFSSISLTGTITLAQLTPGENGAGYPIAGKTLYFHHGHLGSTNLVTDEQANQVSLVNYEPYGEIADSSEGQDIFRAKFTGKEYDSNSDLYYFGARYYNAHLGRFLSADPAGQYFSPYIYGNGDPLSTIDPTGEFAFALVVVAVAVAGGAYYGGATVNQSMNPASWDWSSGKTWAGIVGGAAIGGLGAAAGLAAGGAIAAAGLGTVGTVLANMAVAGGVMGTMSASFTAMGGGSIGDIAASFGIGFAMGALFALPGMGQALTAYNAYAFISDPSLENGIELGMDVMMLGIARGMRLKQGGKSQSEEVGACASFAAETEVLSSEGEMPVEEVAVGDMVWAYNEETGQEGLYPVSHLFTRIAPELVLITAGEEVIEATTEHEFYVDSKGWVEAENLKKGDELVERGAKTEKVTALQKREYSTRVYNLEVEEAHTYYVAHQQVLVHNTLEDCTRRLHQEIDDLGNNVDARTNIATFEYRTRSNDELVSLRGISTSGTNVIQMGWARRDTNPGNRSGVSGEFATAYAVPDNRNRNHTEVQIAAWLTEHHARGGVLNISSKYAVCRDCQHSLRRFAQTQKVAVVFEASLRYRGLPPRRGFIPSR